MRTLIAIPCMDMLHTQFAASLCAMRHVGESHYVYVQGSLPYDARNKLAELALDGDFDRVLWLDSDMRFGPDLAEKLHADLDQGLEMVTALYFKRVPPTKPEIYSEITTDILAGLQPVPRADSYLDYPEDQLFPVAGCGFGAVMMTTQLLRDLRAQYGLPFSPIMGFGEDFSFCLRAREQGRVIWCDSRIKVGHIGMAVFDETTYRQTPVRRVDL